MDIPVAEKVEEKKGPDEYEIRSWAEKIIEAKEIESDPEKMKLVRPLLAKKAKAIQSVADLRDLRAKKAQAAGAEDTSEEGAEEASE